MKEASGDAEFVAEAAGYVDVLDRECAAWGYACGAASLHAALRAMHTLKGAAGFTGEDEVESLAHAVEEVIAPWRESAPGSVDRPTLVHLRNLVAALRRELGLHRGSGSEIPDSRPRLMAGEAFVNLLRQARRMAAGHGKQVQVCLSGTKVPVPPHVVEALRGPLGHVIRNAVAHAVEPPDTRAALGKPYFATILVEVEEGRSEIVVRVRDDGPGFDLMTLKERVVGRGIITDAETRQMNTEELTELAFLDGVSTANEVSALAGRGVGLEAARTAIETANGTLSLSSERGIGTIIEIRMPRNPGPRANAG